MKCSRIMIHFLGMFILSACGGGSTSTLATQNPAPNNVTMVDVGRSVFFDENLSSGGNQSCATCHDPVAGFADPVTTSVNPVSEGSVSGEFGNRNAPTVAYASFAPEFRLTQTPTTSEDGSLYEGGQFWDGRRPDLVEQAKDPFLNPVEMDNASPAEVVDKVRNSTYADDFISVFGADAFDDVDTAYNFIAESLAAFQTSPEVNKFTSKFDAYLAGQYTMNASEMRGFNLFQSNTAKCANCHVINNPSGGPALFTNFKYFNIGTPVNTMNPAYAIDNLFRDEGLAGNPNIDPLDVAGERGKFKTPTLRNIELTAPYMHNGAYDTLDEVITHYDIIVADSFYSAEVNDNIASELNPFTDVGLGLSVQDKNDLINFMLMLTDGYM